MSLQIDVDEFLCIGSATCVRLAEGVFVLNPEGVAVVVDPSATDEATVRRAERSCPTGAIVVREGRGAS